MQIPKNVKIGGLIYSVKEEDNRLRDHNETGASCGNSQEIVLDKNISQQLKETTLIHEILHQINFVYNINLEHQQIYQLEAGLYAFIKDNPVVFGKGVTHEHKN